MTRCNEAVSSPDFERQFWFSKLLRSSSLKMRLNNSESVRNAPRRVHPNLDTDMRGSLNRDSDLPALYPGPNIEDSIGNSGLGKENRRGLILWNQLRFCYK